MRVPPDRTPFPAWRCTHAGQHGRVSLRRNQILLSHVSGYAGAGMVDVGLSPA